jgi:serine protease
MILFPEKRYIPEKCKFSSGLSFGQIPMQHFSGIIVFLSIISPFISYLFPLFRSMKKYLLSYISAILLISFSAKAQQQYIPGEAYVQLQPGISSRIIAENGAVVLEKLTEVFSGIIGPDDILSAEAPFFSAKGSALQRIIRISLRDSLNINSLVQSLDQSPLTVYAEQVPLAYLDYTPNDLGRNENNNQWHLYKILAREAWDIGKGSREIKIAIVDDAVQIDHPDLRENIWVNRGEIPGNGIDDDGNGYIDDVNGFDVGDNDNSPLPQTAAYSHGTHVGGISGASTDNGTGIASIGFNVSLIPVKCTRLNQSSPTQIPRGYEGITYAANAGAHIINCSWGSSGSSNTGRQVVQYAQGKGAIIVAAMGNDGREQNYYPAAYPGVISVASTNNNDTKSDFSNYASYTSISAPGSLIRSSIPNSTYTSYSGTSMATPLVSGLLGLMKSHLPIISNEELQGCLIKNVDDIYTVNTAYRNKLGAGRINALKAMLCVDSIRQNSKPVGSVFPLSGPYCPLDGIRLAIVSKGGKIDGQLWEFPGAQSSVSTETAPLVSYNAPGKYSVTLITWNEQGSDTAVFEDFIEISDKGWAEAVKLDFKGGFAANGWTADGSWTYDSLFYEEDTLYSAVVRAYENTSAGVSGMLTSPVFDLSGYGNSELTLDYSYAPKSAGGKDSLRIWASADGGLSFEAVQAYGISTEMNNAGLSTEAYSPSSSSAWCGNQESCLRIPLKKFDLKENIVLKIEHISSGNDNNFFLKGIKIRANCASWNNSSPIAIVAGINREACGSLKTVFESRSENYPAKYSWYFPGGIPSFSNDPDPTVEYPEEGVYDIAFSVSNEHGSDSVFFPAHVRIKALPQVTVKAGKTSFCTGEGTTLSASGANTYTWSPPIGVSATTGSSINVSPSSTTVYTVTGRNTAGCTSSENIEITILPTPGQQLIFRNGDTLYVPAQANVSYQWYRNKEAIPGAEQRKYFVSESGSYEVTFTHQNSGCTSGSIEPFNVFITGVPHITAEKNYNVYPNPAAKMLTIQDPGGIRSYALIQTDGKVIRQGSGEEKTFMEITLEGLRGGLLMVQWLDNAGNVKREKISVIR